MNLKDIIINAKKISMIFDLDTDGICSAKIVFEALNRMQKEVSGFFPSASGTLNEESLILGIKKSNPDLLIIVDDELRKDSLIARDFECEILVIDHHGISDVPDKKNIHYFNPKLQGNNAYTPASKYCFDLFSELVDISDLDWVAAAGIIADSGAPEHRDFLQKCFKKYEVKLGKDLDYYSDSYFGLLGDIMNSGKVAKGNEGALDALNILIKSCGPDDFYEKSFELRQLNDSINECLNEEAENFEAKRESYPAVDLLFYAVNPKYKIGSVLSTIVSFKHPDKTIVICTKKGRTISVSYRRQDKKVDMNELARKSIKGLKNSGGGGHVPAAGGHILARDLNMLKRNIVRFLRENPAKK